MTESLALLDAPIAPLPIVEDDTAAFWRGGADGNLLIARCGACGFYIHPPKPICPVCLSDRVAPEAVSGRARIASFTTNHQPWTPEMIVPFIVAVVELDEQPSVRLTTNIVGARADEVKIGMAVEATFRQREDVWLPLFRAIRQ